MPLNKKVVPCHCDGLPRWRESAPHKGCSNCLIQGGPLPPENTACRWGEHYCNGQKRQPGGLPDSGSRFAIKASFCPAMYAKIGPLETRVSQRGQDCQRSAMPSTGPGPDGGLTEALPPVQRCALADIGLRRTVFLLPPGMDYNFCLIAACLFHQTMSYALSCFSGDGKKFKHVSI